MAEPIAPRQDPVAPETASTEVVPAQVVVEVAAPRRRRRWLAWLVALLVLAAVLVIGWFVADSAARSWADDYVAEQVVGVLGLPPGTPVEVQLSEGSLLWQALRGSIDEVRVGVAQFPVGELTGRAEFVATGVPLNTSRPVQELEVVLTFPESEVQKLAGYFSGMEAQDVGLRNGMIRMSTEISILFFTFPVTIDLAPSAAPGAISFDPQVIAVGEQEFTVADLRANPQFAAFAGSLLAARDFCIADQLPDAFEVRQVRIIGTQLQLTVGAQQLPLADPGLTTRGSCG